MSSNYYRDNADLQFYMERGIDWEPLVELTEYMYRAEGAFESAKEAVDFYRDIADLVGGFVAEEIGAHAEEIDRAGVQRVDGEAVLPKRQQRIFKAIKGLELHGMCLPRELGGQNCPLLLYMLNTELFARADVSVTAHHGFHGGMAMAMLFFSLSEGSTTWDVENGRIESTRWQKEIEEIRTGKAWGCMDITEPDAGSDMAAIRTRGVAAEDGTWTVTGSKIFITSGHGKYHFVIARTEDTDPDDPFAGLKGLSLFLVPTYSESKEGRKRHVTIDRLEEKLGHHGSVTCSLTFEDAPAQLVGKRGEGFKYMLLLMNNARLGVGFESIGLCEASRRSALAYARERPSMGKTIDQHEMIADYLDEMEVDILGLRALAMAGTFHEEMAQKIAMMERTGLTREAGERGAQYLSQLAGHRRGSRRLTPLLKYLAAEKSVQMARRCVQIHGGAGYTRDYPAEKLLRDAVVMPIYEGTSQIQALMVMKDTLMGIMKRPRGFIKRLAQTRWRAMSARDPLERRVAKLQTVSLATQQHLLTRTATDKYHALKGKPIGEWPQRFFKNWNPKRDFAFAMLHAERLTRLLCDEAICELLLTQARKHPDRRDVLERYLERAEPRARFLHDRIMSTGDRLLGELARNGKNAPNADLEAKAS